MKSMRKVVTVICTIACVSVLVQLIGEDFSIIIDQASSLFCSSSLGEVAEGLTFGVVHTALLLALTTLKRLLQASIWAIAADTCFHWEDVKAALHRRFAK